MFKVNINNVNINNIDDFWWKILMSAELKR